VGVDSYLVILPAFNAAAKIGRTIRELLAVTEDPKRIVVVDDGSGDRTAEIARNFGTVLLQHRKNRGKGAALKTGFQFALSSGISEIVVLDADGQHNPRLVPNFLTTARDGGFDLVLGVRDMSTKNMPPDRRLSNRLSSLVISLVCGRRIPDSQCGYRFVHLRRYPSMKLRSRRFEFESELLIRYCRSGAKIGFLNIPTVYADEPSSIRRAADTVRFLIMLAKTVCS